MAKESLKAKEIKRAKLVAKYAEKRKELKKVINNLVYIHYSHFIQEISKRQVELLSP